MLYHQTTTNQTKINELKTIPCYKYELMKPSKHSLRWGIVPPSKTSPPSFLPSPPFKGIPLYIGFS